MKLQGLPPSMEDGGDTWSGAKIFWIRAKLKKSFRSGGEKDVGRRFEIGKEKRVEGIRQSEHHVIILNRQGIFHLFLSPTGPISTLTDRAMSIAAGMKESRRSTALGASLNETAKSSRTAVSDMVQDLYGAI